ncbi:CRP-like cAMP-binding protein [Micromonospora pisi]|uniref:CRP-like cAMP-binding protein n=1 Tax=Micromonospora pisi TaxID=589240 RepID=A0A495JEB1_9ACTN|nr:Crp/Fnr family transcriptional regulator [Micromonospora pisi]RKR87245.1 CRP-like cAMP-binding protein [Micromonospora pisi]
MNDVDSQHRPAQNRWPASTFAGRLGPGEHDALMRLGRRTDFVDGQYLLRQGERSRHLLLLLSGRVKIMVTSPDEHLHRIGSRSPGDLIGEMSYLDGRPRSASVVGMGSVTAAHITHKAFDRFLEHHPAAHRPFARLLTDRLRASDSRHVGSAYDTVTRIATALCQLTATVSDRTSDDIIIHTTQRELAQMVSAAPVSVYRALQKLAAQGYLETRHKAIVIRDLDGLADAAKRLPKMHHLM